VNQIGGIPGVRIGLDEETGTGIAVWGSERAGWREMSGVSGGVLYIIFSFVHRSSDDL
jgi:hypothetical protein